MSPSALSNALQKRVATIADSSFAMGVYRPPSEGGSASLLLRITENCPWNKCTFCEMYKGHPFVYRSVKAIKADIDSIRKISEVLVAVSRELGQDGNMTHEVAMAILRADPFLRDNYCFINVFTWLQAGGKTAFLQDADSMIMRPHEMVAVLQHLRETLTTLTRVTSYTRSKTLARRKPEELSAIRAAGLDRLHVGLETGDDELLAFIRKGVTSAEQIDSGKKAMAAGFQLSEYWMPGLGGTTYSQQHAANTARVLTAINPDYIRSRPFVPRRGTPIYEDCARGKLQLSSPLERLDELKLMIEALEVTSRVCFDHAMNSWRTASGALLFHQDYEGYKFPEEKPLVLDLIREGLLVGQPKQIISSLL